MTSPAGFEKASLFVTYGVSRRYNGGRSIGLGGAAHKETYYCWGTSPKSVLLCSYTPTANAVGYEKCDVFDVSTLPQIFTGRQ